MKILGIETSCDETSVAVVNDNREILSHIVLSQTDLHKVFGGVVPEIAARGHIDAISEITEQALKDANLSLNEIDAIAVTAGPGLIGGVLVGAMFAKGIATALNKPIIAVNHLEGHALTARLTNDVEFPFILLLVSGGHCQILDVSGVGNYKVLGRTQDDAVGEAFDKVAKMLGLGYPGGPIVEKRARDGDENRFEFPKPLLKQSKFDFSFSGLKTAVKNQIQELGELSEQDINDICASFQKTVSEVLCNRLVNVFKANPEHKRLVIAGGVAANQYLRAKLEQKLKDFGVEFIAPPLKLCTDNGAMIAWAGLERFKLGLIDEINFEPRSRWPLEELKIRD